MRGKITDDQERENKRKKELGKSIEATKSINQLRYRGKQIHSMKNIEIRKTTMWISSNRRRKIKATMAMKH